MKSFTRRGNPYYRNPSTAASFLELLSAASRTGPRSKTYFEQRPPPDAQKAQYALIREYILNHTRIPKKTLSSIAEKMLVLMGLRKQQSYTLPLSCFHTPDPLSLQLTLPLYYPIISQYYPSSFDRLQELLSDWTLWDFHTRPLQVPTFQANVPTTGGPNYSPNSGY